MAACVPRSSDTQHCKYLAKGKQAILQSLERTFTHLKSTAMPIIPPPLAMPPNPLKAIPLVDETPEHTLATNTLPVITSITHNCGGKARNPDPVNDSVKAFNKFTRKQFKTAANKGGPELVTLVNCLNGIYDGIGAIQSGILLGHPSLYAFRRVSQWKIGVIHCLLAPYQILWQFQKMEWGQHSIWGDLSNSRTPHAGERDRQMAEVILLKI